MDLQVLGLSHHTAPLALRERVAFAAESLAPALKDLASQAGIEEAAIVSTCNRTELYVRGGDAQALRDWLAHAKHLDAEALEPALYHHAGMNAVRHLYRVASGLDSMVLGEPQILGQVKQAARFADTHGTMGPTLSQLFQRTFAVAKQVRATTAIGASSISMAAAGVRLAQQIFDDFSRLGMLFIGAGEMIDLAAAHFVARKPARVAVANRTLERGEALAQRLGARAITLAELHGEIADFDIVVSCTASTIPIVGKGMMESAVRARRHRPVFMLDLAVPRDIEPEVAKLDDVFLFTLDDLGRIVSEGRDKRAEAVDDAEGIIDRAVAEFVTWFDTRSAVPTIRLMRDYAEEYRGREMERARAALARGDEPAAVLEAFSRSLLNKFLHHPTTALQRAAPEERGQIARLIARLYNLPDSE